jgi:predicted RNA-binding protein Jag
MNAIQESAEKFLAEILRDFGFDLRISSAQTEEGYYFDLTGDDAGFLLSESGEALDALEVMLFLANRLKKPNVLSAMPKAFARREKRNCRQWRDLPPRTSENPAVRLLLEN